MIMKMEKEMKYEVPEVEILEIEVEKGYEISAGGADEGVPGL
ncbi:hypothetical protein [Bacteroides rodentium]|nr:hypothetical protein [Bacteroides rodentium]